MEVLAVVAGVIVAVGGWVANGILTRRAMRRQLRVEYLLRAYHRFEGASNRDMTAEHDAAIEDAVSEIQLLGTAEQVHLAQQFAAAFAASGSADTEPLLESLRRSLRTELLLEPLPNTRTWLRITRDGRWAQQQAFVRASVRAAIPTESAPGKPERTSACQSSTSPIEDVLAMYEEITLALQHLLGRGHDTSSAISPVDLVQEAIDRSIITTKLAEAIEGIGVLRNLAAHGTEHISPERAREFRDLVDAVLYAIRHNARPSN